MTQKSRVLLLVACSNTKVRLGESPDYDRRATIAAHLDSDATQLLLDGRRRVREIVTEKQVWRTGRPLVSLPYNKGLVPGPDFGVPDVHPSGGYLPAVLRYEGRFFSELGPGRLDLLTRSPHHVLIVSALYGLLLPTEPIQCYSCTVTDHPSIPQTWTTGDRMSRILTAYVRTRQVATVIDLLGIDAYRRLFSWEMIRRATTGRVLHAFSPQFAGDALLRPLGAVAQRFLATPAQTLQRLQPGHAEGTPYENVLFEATPVPGAHRNLARELERQRQRLSAADLIGRMRRSYIRILDKLDPASSPLEGFRDRVVRLKSRGLASAAAERMLVFNRTRNAVEYRGEAVSTDRLNALLSDYRQVATWATRTISHLVMDDIDTEA